LGLRVRVHDDAGALLILQFLPTIPNDADMTGFGRWHFLFQDERLEIGAGGCELLDKFLDKSIVPGRRSGRLAYETGHFLLLKVAILSKEPKTAWNTLVISPW